MTDYHQPVLLDQVISLLDISPQKIYLDATLGNGGHTIAMLQKGAVVYSLDQDPQNLKIASHRISQLKLDKNFHPLLGNFSQLNQLVKKHHLPPLNGLLFDLGLSRNQQTSSGRGFSFNDPLSLDMRLNPKSSSQISAENLINTADFDTLYQIFTKYAQEKYSKPLILRIIRQRQKKPITTATDLAKIIRDYYQSQSIPTKIDPSTKIFMALRIHINHEFDNLKSALNQTITTLQSGSIVAIISFHSGEDRLVKNFIRQNRQLIVNLTPKAIRPSAQEISQNPLSRSAVLRSYRIK